MGDFKLTRVDATLPTTACVVHPEWALEEQAQVDAARQRSLAGNLATTQWDFYGQFHVPLKEVPGDVAMLVRDWWSAGAAVAFTLDTSAQRSTVVCAIANTQQPLADRTAPTLDRWAGVLQLNARNPGDRVGQPFILDDPVFGRLDEPFLTLVQ